ncbi:MAG: hypothetical protein INR65_07855, partial [Gluconacetobacter diazotrophicus]|nr:hypothetical protein [Gluconacetobacter diazotrophicus]
AGFVSYWSQPAGRSRPRPVPQYRLGWQDESGTWRDTPASAFTTPFDLDGGGTLPLPHSRPELLFDDADRAFVLWRSIETGNRLMLRVLSPPDYDIRDSEAVVLWDHDLGFYEPVPSRDAWQRDRELVLLVQHCDQKRDHDGTPHAGGTPIVLARWNHDQLLP